MDCMQINVLSRHTISLLSCGIALVSCIVFFSLPVGDFYKYTPCGVNLALAKPAHCGDLNYILKVGNSLAARTLEEEVPIIAAIFQRPVII